MVTDLAFWEDKLSNYKILPKLVMFSCNYPCKSAAAVILKEEAVLVSSSQKIFHVFTWYTKSVVFILTKGLKALEMFWNIADQKRGLPNWS